MGISNDYIFDETHPIEYEVIMYHKINKLVDNDINPHAIYLYKVYYVNIKNYLKNLIKYL